MDRRLRSAIGFVVVSVGLAGPVAGCAYLESRDGPVAGRAATESAAPRIPPDIRSVSSVEALVRYGALLRSIPADALEREYTQVAEMLAHDASAPNRIRMALLLSLPGASFQDDPRARGYLKKVIDDAGYNASQYHGIARFLAAMLDDRKQLEGAVADERRQRQELQQKLDQLKAIEQDTGARIPPKPMKEN